MEHFDNYLYVVWCVSWQAVAMVTRFCNTVFPVFAESINFAMAMLITCQLIAFLFKIRL